MSGRRAKALRRAERERTLAVLDPDARPTPDSPPLAVAPGLSWQAQREAWNRAGQCSRAACRAELRPGLTFRHPDTRLLYCGRCTVMLEEMNPGLVLSEAS
jgi:hypothetical protein